MNNLDREIRSQWGSPLSMAYHWMKHNKEFRITKDEIVSVDKYFNQHSNAIFRPDAPESNRTGTSFTQSGGMKHSYAKRFGTRRHVGYSVDDGAGGERLCSHFTQKNK